jgi:hypothetical protein
MTDMVLGRAIYLVKEHCDAVLTPPDEDCDIAQLMENMWRCAQKVAAGAPANQAVASINEKVAEVYAAFETAGYALTEGVRCSLTEIAEEVEKETRRLYGIS